MFEIMLWFWRQQWPRLEFRRKSSAWFQRSLQLELFQSRANFILKSQRRSK
jgi:hypothetical protein